jgi:hypothetical protein
MGPLVSEKNQLKLNTSPKVLIAAIILGRELNEQTTEQLVEKFEEQTLKLNTSGTIESCQKVSI